MSSWQLSFKPVGHRKLRQGNVLGDLVMFSVICEMLCLDGETCRGRGTFSIGSVMSEMLSWKCNVVSGVLSWMCHVECALSCQVCLVLLGLSCLVGGVLLGVCLVLLVLFCRLRRIGIVLRRDCFVADVVSIVLSSCS